MKTSFNRARKNLAKSFNNVIRNPSPENLHYLKQWIQNLLFMEDPDDYEDCDCLIDKVHLEDIDKVDREKLVRSTESDEAIFY